MTIRVEFVSSQNGDNVLDFGLCWEHVGDDHSRNIVSEHEIRAWSQRLGLEQQMIFGANLAHCVCRSKRIVRQALDRDGCQGLVFGEDDHGTVRPVDNPCFTHVHSIHEQNTKQENFAQHIFGTVLCVSEISAMKNF